MGRPRSLSHYRDRWEGMEIVPRLQNRVDKAVARCIRGKARYQAVEAETGVPWVWHAVLHEREGSCNFNKQYVNGQNWRKKTTLYPPDRGPWKSWEDSATKTTRRNKWHLRKDWGVLWQLKRAEGHNGWGYEGLDVISPYVWRCAKCCVGVGKYVADHDWDPNAGPKDRQVGVAPLLAGIIAAGEWAPGEVVERPPGPLIAYGMDRDVVGHYQCFLNETLAGSGAVMLDTDDKAGPMTNAAHHAVFGHHLAGHPDADQQPPQPPKVDDACFMTGLAEVLKDTASKNSAAARMVDEYILELEPQK